MEIRAGSSIAMQTRSGSSSGIAAEEYKPRLGIQPTWDSAQSVYLAACRTKLHSLCSMPRLTGTNTAGG